MPGAQPTHVAEASRELGHGPGADCGGGGWGTQGEGKRVGASGQRAQRRRWGPTPAPARDGSCCCKPPALAPGVCKRADSQAPGPRRPSCSGAAASRRHSRSATMGGSGGSDAALDFLLLDRLLELSIFLISMGEETGTQGVLQLCDRAGGGSVARCGRRAGEALGTRVNQPGCHRRPGGRPRPAQPTQWHARAVWQATDGRGGEAAERRSAA